MRNHQTELPDVKTTGRRRLYLMRHGHVDYFTPGLTDPRGVPLTDEGRAQAAAAAAALSSVRFDFAAYSGLPRTQQTAEIVLAEQEKPLPLTAIEGFEELKSGWVQAKTREELAAYLAFCFDEADAPDARFLPDGEKFVDAERRILKALKDLFSLEEWRTALLVAHEGVNRILISCICGAGLSSLASFEQDMACINVLDFDLTPNQNGHGVQIERAVLKALNVTPYDYLKDGLPRTSLEHLFGVDFGGARPAQRPAPPEL